MNQWGLHPNTNIKVQEKIEQYLRIDQRVMIFSKLLYQCLTIEMM
jgi:hypothetical protein